MIQKDNVTQKDGSLTSNSNKTPVLFLIFFIIFFLLITALTSWLYISLNNQILEDRQKHINEAADKADNIVHSVKEQALNCSNLLESLINNNDALSEHDLINTLKLAANSVNSENMLAIAFNNKNYYYSSDDTEGIWQNTDILSKTVSATHIPHLNSAENYIFIVKQLNNKPVISGNLVTHIAIAINPQYLRKLLKANGFSDEYHIYIINNDRDLLYSSISNNDINTECSILSFLNNSHKNNTIANIINDKSCMSVFENGRRFFAAGSFGLSNDVSVLMCIPSEFISANFTSFLNTIFIYFFLIIMFISLLFSASAFFIMHSSRERRIIKQKDEINTQLSESIKLANHANLAKSKFLSRISHDIRTPINGIMGSALIARKNINDTDKISYCLDKIDGSCRHLLSLVNNVLDMSKIESGKVQTTQAPMNIKTAVDNCAAIIYGQLENRNINFTHEFNFNHTNIIGDELRLRQVFINILGNAVKFTPEGGRIIFRATETDFNQNTANYIFEFEDSGAGMHPDFLERIWEPFAQDERDSQEMCQGTGLGMAITKQFVDMMGGTINVKSELGKGSRFTVKLSFPINKNTVHKNKTTCDIDTSGMKVLLAEDNELNMEIASELLKAEGVDITPAKNGEMALQLFEKSALNYYDAVLMDVMMPVMDGISAAKRIRALNRKDAETVPILAMTANAFDEDIKATRQAGMNAHLSKPIDITAVLKTLSKYNKARIGDSISDEKLIDIKSIS